MKKVTINVNKEEFSAICSKAKTDHCNVSVFSRNLTKYAKITFNTKHTETERVVSLKCDDVKSAKELFMAVRAICDTCVYRKVNQNQK